MSFPRPLDYGLLHRALTVSLRGTRVAGEVRLDAGETRWLFIPHERWQAGEYRLLVSSILEDVAGNRIGRPFEVKGPADGKLATEAKSAVLTFRVVAGTAVFGVIIDERCVLRDLHHPLRRMKEIRMRMPLWVGLNRERRDGWPWLPRGRSCGPPLPQTCKCQSDRRSTSRRYWPPSTRRNRS